MSLSSLVCHGARRPAFPAAAPERAALGVAALVLACVGCDLDDRILTTRELTLTSPLGAGDAGAFERGDAGTSASADDPPTPPSEFDDEPEVDAERPIVALGDALPTALLGGETGKDERARCVEGVLIGLDYAFNGPTATSFPARFTFVSPLCALPNVSDGALELLEPADIAWSEVGGDGTPVVRPVPTHRLLCPEGYAVVGLSGTMDEVQESPQIFAVRELELDCAPLLVKAERVDIARGAIASVSAESPSAVPGSLRVDVACDEGTTAATGAIVRWGSWLDGTGLQCSHLAWPFTAGHGCALDEDCQSGVCESFATCAP